MPGGLSRVLLMAENGGKLPERKMPQPSNARNEQLWALPRFKLGERQSGGVAAEFFAKKGEPDKNTHMGRRDMPV